MSNDLDERLRKALRLVDPGEAFTQGVLARVGNEPARPTSWLAGPRLRWLSVGLAGSLLLGVLVAHDRQARRTEEGLEARRQLLEALRVTSNKLDIAYRVVNDRDSEGTAGPDS